MGGSPVDPWSRREVLGGLTLAGAAGLLGLRVESTAVEPPPETTKLRLTYSDSACFAPQYVAEELLRDDGFTDVQYVKAGLAERLKALASGQIHMGMAPGVPFIIPVDEAVPIVALAGIHSGCYELFATERVRSIRDLKGKTIAVNSLGDPNYVFLASMLAYVGLDARKDITWLERPWKERERLFAEGKTDATLELLPTAEFRARKLGHVPVNPMMDRPWSQYFCCMVFAGKEFVRTHPVATKRALRAILRGADLCARKPERVARFLADRGYVKPYDYALQVVKEIPYGKWRDYDPEDTLRFYALRLNEAGMIKSTPQKIIAEGTDWRFLRELKAELKG